MKQKLTLIALVIVILLFTLSPNTQAQDSKYRLGLQGTHFVAGLSGIYDFSPPWAMQGVIDFGVDAFAFRVLNRFHNETYWNAYGLGTIGIWDKGNGNDDDKSALGLGFGVGVEYDWRGLSPSLPPIGWSLELGASIIPDFDLDFGIGIHWKF